MHDDPTADPLPPETARATAAAGGDDDRATPVPPPKGETPYEPYRPETHDDPHGFVGADPGHLGEQTARDGTNAPGAPKPHVSQSHRHYQVFDGDVRFDVFESTETVTVHDQPLQMFRSGAGASGASETFVVLDKHGQRPGNGPSLSARDLKLLKGARRDSRLYVWVGQAYAVFMMVVALGVFGAGSFMMATTTLAFLGDRTPGNVTVTYQGCRGACTSYGTFVSDDGARTFEHVEVEGAGEEGSVRRAFYVTSAQAPTQVYVQSWTTFRTPGFVIVAGVVIFIIALGEFRRWARTRRQRQRDDVLDDLFERLG